MAWLYKYDAALRLLYQDSLNALVGLDREAAKSARNAILKGRTPTGNQNGAFSKLVPSSATGESAR